MTSVFISYSRKDRAAADFVADALRQRGADVFIDYQRLQGGEDFVERLGREIERRDAVVLMFSPHSAQSKWVKDEVAYARHHNKPIVPVILEKVTDMAAWFFLIRLEQVDLMAWGSEVSHDHALDKLCAALGMSEREAAITPPEGTAAASPLALKLVIHGHSGKVVGAEFSAGGGQIVTASEDRTLKIWDTSSGNGLNTFSLAPMEQVRSLALSPEGDMIAVAGSIDPGGYTAMQGALSLWWKAAAGWEPLGQYYEKGAFHQARFSNGLNLIAIASDQRKLILLHSVTRSKYQEIDDRFTDSLRTVAFDPSSRFLAAGTYKGDLYLHDLTQPQNEALFLKISPLAQFPVWDIAFSADTRLLAAASDNPFIPLWNPSQPAQMAGTLSGHKSAVYALAFHPLPAARSLLASGSRDGTLILWDVTAQQALQMIPSAHQEAIMSLAFSADGQLLASASNDGAVKVWSVRL